MASTDWEDKPVGKKSKEAAAVTPSKDARPPLEGGYLLSAISQSIVGILRQNYGRGPVRAKTYALDDIIVVVMRGSGFTPLEQTIMDSGEPESANNVVAMRENFQRVIATRYKATIEELTDRKVLAFLSQAHVDPDITIEIFFIDRPMEGFGAVEVIDAGKIQVTKSTHDLPNTDLVAAAEHASDIQTDGAR
ncbi:MAG: DUF2294 domain-containing protein [Actinomycetota bacterium]|nr:DUF2294 domain-containing protein [Actinomycetota bacterium]